MTQLRQQIEHYKYLYYHSPERHDYEGIPDAEFDRLLRELEGLEQRYSKWRTKNSPTQSVGVQLPAWVNAVAHKEPMLSITNAFDAKELQAFVERCKHLIGSDTLTVAAEPKLDGIAVNLSYQHGQLVRAATRGDGSYGEDVTNNARIIRNLPQFLGNAPDNTEGLPALLEVRAEVVIQREDFKHLNQQRQHAGDKPFANPRNAAAGSLQQLDTKLCIKRPLLLFLPRYRWY